MRQLSILYPHISVDDRTINYCERCEMDILRVHAILAVCMMRAGVHFLTYEGSK